jgi:coenzyme F420 hydrogenase subunit beta
MTPEQVKKRLEKVIRHRNCSGCGACVLYSNNSSVMVRTPAGPIPETGGANFSEEALKVCPGISIHYPSLYDYQYGAQLESYLYGKIEKARIGFAGSEEIRSKGASGGVISATLIYLLRKKKIDGAVCVQQGLPSPLKASALIARNEEEVMASMQSVYIPVSVLDILQDIVPGERYAMVCLPEQSAALRKLQSLGHPAALQVKYVLGPYTGTALYPSAIDAFLRMKGVEKNDRVISLKWREGEWPGHLEIRMESGKILQSKKIYYNFLIPFFITHTSLRSMDFVNEFADLSVGDAWSPRYESEGKGFSVYVTRTQEMEEIVHEMISQGLLDAEEIPKEESVAMHGHMLDFKKRGGYLRNRMRTFFGYSVPDYGYRPVSVALTRKMTELVISVIFLMAGNRMARWCMTRVPESVLGPLFDFMRLRWKSFSKPAKRKGLNEYAIVVTEKKPNRKR